VTITSFARILLVELIWPLHFIIKPLRQDFSVIEFWFQKLQ
jgi:hypothetical protein